ARGICDFDSKVVQSRTSPGVVVHRDNLVIL
ncbi:MAG: hypothetical protein JWO95_1954, partial [Verrucomicrobiales bacterium]|nr:hypothetical protein [Verrucomicrobiales bacterium]